MAQLDRFLSPSNFNRRRPIGSKPLPARLYISHVTYRIAFRPGLSDKLGPRLQSMGRRALANSSTLVGRIVRGRGRRLASCRYGVDWLA
jgi:hypothetical protein